MKHRDSTVTNESELKPDDARQLMLDIEIGIYTRVSAMNRDAFTIDVNQPLPSSEKGKQHYGNDVFQLFEGITAALRNWDESGNKVKELKEDYGGKFVTGVEIGERLAVYEDRDFKFVQ